MATTPVKPTAPAAHVPEKVEVPGVPPQPHVEEEAHTDESNLPESTKAEMKAGKDALAAYKDFNKAEIEGGRKALEEYNRTHPQKAEKAHPEKAHPEK